MWFRSTEDVGFKGVRGVTGSEFGLCRHIRHGVKGRSKKGGWRSVSGRWESGPSTGRETQVRVTVCVWGE